MSELNLLPCPCCGSDDVAFGKVEDSRSWVICGTCGLNANSLDTLPEAGPVAVWNTRRAQPEATPQAVADAKRLLEREMRDAQTLASLLKQERERFEFLHSTNCDAEGWEWGVARIRVNQYGEVEYLWGLSDHSDIDAARQAKETGNG